MIKVIEYYRRDLVRESKVAFPHPSCGRQKTWISWVDRLRSGRPVLQIHYGLCHTLSIFAYQAVTPHNEIVRKSQQSHALVAYW